MSSEESTTDTQSWSEERLQSALTDSALLKAEGNTYFTQKNWQNAIVAYEQALEVLPPSLPRVDRIGKSKAPEERSDDDKRDNDSDGENEKVQEAVVTEEEKSQTENESGKEESAPKQPLTPLQKECSAARVVLLSNMAQCHIKLVC